MVDASQFAGQPLGGVEIRFPVNGDSDTIDATHYDQRYTPASANVIFRKPYNGDFCGGTRPGLKAFSGEQPTASDTSHWLWPNGEVINWPDGDAMAFSELGAKVTMPDGGVMFNRHETFNVAATKGNAPEGCTAMSFYRARMVVAKDTMWYASRLGATDDWDYGGDSEDPSRALAGNIALAGKSGEEITCIAGINDATLYIATNRSIWRVMGEITAGLGLVSDSIGIVSADAWCYNGGMFWFVGPEGLYVIAPEAPPVLMTPHLSRRFSAWQEATLVYDAERNGIHIFGTDKEGNASDWWYDIDNKAAWRLSYPSAIRPLSGGLAMLDGHNRVTFLCADGVFRYWDESQADDDGTDIASALALGPVTHTTGNTDNGFLAEVDCETDTSITTEDGVGVSGVIGRTHHEVLDLAVAAVDKVVGGEEPEAEFTYVQVAGWNKVFRPRVRCNSFSIIVWAKKDRWAISKVTAVHRGCGRIRG